ncbi:MAG TPA: VanZ family protein [Candidatus Aminicenantes bacterium]|nr:VanZ family protein [Candidatus Aminicenantes bacterium]
MGLLNNLFSRNAVPLFFRWFPPIAVYALIFWLSAQTPAGLPKGIPDIIPHFLEFLVLGFLLARAICPRNRIGMLLVLLLLLLLALGDEFHQAFVPGRVCALNDFLVDSAGALAGIMLWGKLERRGQASRDKRTLDNSEKLKVKK